MNLFCFPYAGGSATFYNSWKKFLYPSVKIQPIELAGRGRRINEAHYKDFAHLLDDVFSIVEPGIQNEPYAFFGHSMGAKIAFELLHEIEKHKLPGPAHAFFSGRGAPYIKGKNEKKYTQLSDGEFKNAVLELGGTSKEIFEDPELEAIFFPLLRNDFSLSKTELQYDNKFILSCDMTLFLGKGEDIDSKQITGWKDCTAGQCTINFFNGGHFFINDYIQEIIQKINYTLTNKW